MDKKEKKFIIAMIVLAVVVLGAIWYLKVGYLLKKPEIPEANIAIQTQMVDGGAISLRNADYTGNQIKIRYEVKGFSLTEYNIACEIYHDGHLISTSGSTGGGLIELDEKHYYFIASENIIQMNLPQSIHLNVEIKVIPNDFRQKSITSSFDVSLDKKVK